MRITRILAGAALAAAVAWAGPPARAEQTVVIGTGGATGVYYPAGGAICRMVNRERRAHGIRCAIAATGGSIDNARGLRAGAFQLGIVQSDVQAAAHAGTGRFAEAGADPELRALFSLHPEPVHLMARADAGVSRPADLRGKRVNIANPGSGTRVLAMRLLASAGLSTGDLALAAELESSEQAAALCEGRIDVSIWAAGLPNGAAQDATSTCRVRLVPLDGPATERLLAETPAYARATIPGRMYRGNPDDIPSWGPLATVVTSARLPAEIAYRIVKAVFDELEDFRKLHPAFARLDAAGMVRDGLTAPLHPGALRYYRERGWR